MFLGSSIYIKFQKIWKNDVITISDLVKGSFSYLGSGGDKKKIIIFTKEMSDEMRNFSFKH